MSRTYTQFVLGLLALIVIAGGIAGCTDRNVENAGKHDTPEAKEQRQSKKGD